MRWSWRKMVVAVAAVFVVAGLVAGALLALRGNMSAKQAAATGLTSPFTGKPVAALKPVLAVKIDNIVYARPQTGLTHADIVYVLPVEGGLSRLMAIFSSSVPQVAGPVRSAREDDIELLRQFGRPAFAYSGATPALLPYIRRHARIADEYAGTTSGYYRNHRRAAPYNLYGHARRLVAQANGASLAHSIGYRFGPAPAGGKPTGPVSVAYASASFTFTWSNARRCWLVSMDGAPALTTDGGRLRPATVVIQYTKVRSSAFKEYGSRPPYAQSTGSGRAVVLRDGRAWQATWSRPTADGGTTYTTAAGQPMTFSTGQVWVVLAYR